MNNAWKASAARGVRSTVPSRGTSRITACSPVTGVSYSSSQPAEQKHPRNIVWRYQRGICSNLSFFGVTHSKVGQVTWKR